MHQVNELSDLVEQIAVCPGQISFSTLSSQYFHPVMDAVGLKLEDLLELLGSQGDDAIICALEDFVAMTPARVLNKVIARRFNKKPARNDLHPAKYWQAVRSSALSLYAVVDVVAGSRLILRDLIQGGDKFEAVQHFQRPVKKCGDLLGGRVIATDRGYRLTIGQLPFSKTGGERLLASLSSARSRTCADGAALLDGAQLRAAAPLFAISWILGRLETSSFSGIMPASSSRFQRH